jgi:isoprenylcysteine carboxyl methyltransferase (ICMT) family protein YpbQ
MSMHALERGVQVAAGIAGVATLLLALSGLLKSVLEPKSPRSQSVGAAPRWLFVLLGTAGYVAVCVWLWKPIPLELVATTRLALIVIGVPLYLSGLILYLGAMQVLAEAYRLSSFFADEVAEEQGLITAGPYAYIRHPMYLALSLTAIGGLLLFKTWAMVFTALSCTALVFRARREEQALERVFGEVWRRYRSRVPAWFPQSRARTERKDQEDRVKN